MSTLWVANEETHSVAPPSGNQVIIKIARMSETRYSLTNQRAIENEEKWLIALEHPNIVRLRPIAEKHASRQTVYRARSDLPGSPWFLVTDYLPGGDLYALLGDSNKLPVSLALEIAERVGSALAYLHARNCIHCDIKPRNILFRQRPNGYRLTADTQPIVIDFGIAKNPSDGPQLASGTPRWITPELADALKDGRKIEVQPSWDTYALGLVLYTMVTGRKPELDTPGRDSWTTITSSDLAGDPSVKQMAPLVRGLNELITRTTAERARDRISAADFTSEVQRLLGMVQTPLPTAQRQQRPRSPWWVWAGATAAFLLVAALLWMARPSTAPTDTDTPIVVVTVTDNGGNGGAGGQLTPPKPGNLEEGPSGAAAAAFVPTKTATVVPRLSPTSTRVHTPTPTHTRTPTATATPRPPTNTPSATPRPATVTSTATPRPPTGTPTATPAAGAGPTSTKAGVTSTPLPTDTPTPRPPTPIPPAPAQTDATRSATTVLPASDMRVALNAPANGFSAQGKITFEWASSRPLLDNECFEVRLWSGTPDNWQNGEGVANAGKNNSLTVTLQKDYGQAYWGVLLAEDCAAYRAGQQTPLRLVSPVHTLSYDAEGD